MKRVLQLGILLIIWFGLAGVAESAETFSGARPIKDPVTASRAVYGRIDRPGQVSYYSITPSQTVSVNIEAVVPVRHDSPDFRPSVSVSIPGITERASVPFSVPGEYGVQIVESEGSNPRQTLFDPNSIERFYRGHSETFSLPGGQTSYLAVYDPSGHTGDYVLGVASRTYFENADRSDLVVQGVALKFGAAEGRALPWADVSGVVLSLLGLIAAGGVALLAVLPSPRGKRRLRRWHYWSAAAAFASILMYYAGLRILNRTSGMIAVASFQEILSVLLLLAAVWFVLQPPDRPPRRYRVFVWLWGAGWLAQTILLAWYLLVTRTT